MSALKLDAAVALSIKDPLVYSTKESLLGLLNKVDVSATGKVTVFYGSSINDVSTSKIISFLLEEDVDSKCLDKTEAFNLLNSKEFMGEVAKDHGLKFDDMHGDIPLTPDKEILKNKAYGWFYHPKEGPWALVSRNFALQTEGKVIFLGPNATEGRIFGQTELPALFDADKVTHIEGISLEDLQQMKWNVSTPEKGLSVVFNKVKNMLERILRLVVLRSFLHMGKFMAF